MTDLNEIAVFVAVVDEGSFTRAAKKLGLPKSTVSRRLGRLEDSLGVRLLERTTRRIRLTEVGERYYRDVSRGLATLDEATVAVTEAQETPRGTLRITAPVDVGVAYLGDLVTAFTTEYPLVVVDVGLTGRTLDLMSDEIDVAFRAGVLADSSLVARKLFEVELHLFASEAYLDRYGEPATLEELASHRCVLFGDARRTRRWALSSADGGSASVSVDGVVGGDDFSFVVRAAVAGAGIGLAPAFMVARELEAGTVRRVLCKHWMNSGGLHLVYPSARHMSAKVRVFRDFVIDWFAALPSSHAGERLSSPKLPPPDAV